jgi:transposase
MHVNTIGVDLAKNVFQVHGVDSAGKVVITRQLRRKQVLEFFSKLPGCLVGMEACGTGHHWAREISKLGHTVRLMPPSYVKGYVKRSKNDAADAAAICEAVTRPSMRFVLIKSTDQQALLMLHRTRDLLIRQRTQLINALRAHLAEFGLVAETGREGLAQLGAIITDESNHEALPSAMKQALQAIVDQLAALELQVGALDRAIHAHHRANDMSCRLETVPGIGVIGATAIASTVADPSGFKSGRDFAAWIGLVPRQHSTGGKERLGGISKQGDRYLRRLLVIGATAVVRQAAKASLDHEAPGQETSQARRRCGGQQDGAHRVGDHSQRRILSSARTCCSHLKRLGNGSMRRRRSKTIELRG